MSEDRVLGIVLAGGEGTRLHPLTSVRSKPAVPFGDRYRIIDFVLSNFVNSRIYSIYMLVPRLARGLRATRTDIDDEQHRLAARKGPGRPRRPARA